MRTLNILSSSVHKITKRFRESGDVAESQLWMAIFRPLRHDPVMEITAWAQGQMHKVKALPCKEEAKREHDPETLPSSLDQSLFKMQNEAKFRH